MQVALQVTSSLPASRFRYVSLVQTPLAMWSLVAFVVAGVLAIVWTPLAPARLFDFDEANFALSLDYFQPAAHQPQPPGYPLYVGLIKVIHQCVEDVPATFLIAGLLGATASILLLGILGERMFGRRVGIFGGLLLMTNPILWQTGMTDQVRMFIAVISIAVALVLWPGWEVGLSPGRLSASCLLLGILAGFRPEMLVSMTPLIAITALRSKMKLRHYLLGGVTLLAGMAPWMIVLISRVGGPISFWEMMRAYSEHEAGKSSVLFGANSAGALKMLESALWWVSLGAVSWIPGAILVRWRKARDDRRLGALFLLTWFLSLFLFSIIVHIAASGHALGFIPVLCLAGGWVLSAVGRTRSRVLMIACVVAAFGLNVLFFFKPYSKEVKEASYKTVGVISGINETTLDTIDLINLDSNTFLVSAGGLVPWRILEYYYPRLPLLYLPSPLGPADPSPVWLIQHRLLVRDIDPKSELILPSCGSIVWLVNDDKLRRELLEVNDSQAGRNFILTPSQPGMHFRVGRYRLRTATEPCHSPDLRQ